MQDHLYPNLGIVRNMKPTYVSWYFIPGKSYRLRHIDAETSKCLVMSFSLIEYMSKFHVLKYHLSEIWAKTKAQFPDLKKNKQFDNSFYVDKLIKDHLTITICFLPLTVDRLGYNEDSISFFIFFNVQWNMMTTKLSSTMSLSQYHACCQYLESMCIPLVLDNLKRYLKVQ